MFEFVIRPTEYLFYLVGANVLCTSIIRYDKSMASVIC